MTGCNCGYNCDDCTDYVLAGTYETTDDCNAACSVSPTCDGCPDNWTFTISGVTGTTGPGATCDNTSPPGGTATCSNWNHTETLTTQGSCTWASVSRWTCPGDDDVGWFMGFDVDSGRWELALLSVAPLKIFPVYVLSGSLNCFGCNTFTLANSPNTCTGWPSTVSVCPV